VETIYCKDARSSIVGNLGNGERGVASQRAFFLCAGTKKPRLYNTNVVIVRSQLPTEKKPEKQTSW
jgi:hypothetical protein